MVQGVSNSIELIENELTFDDRNPLYSFVALFREIIVLKCSQYWSLSQSSGNMNTSQNGLCYAYAVRPSIGLLYQPLYSNVGLYKSHVTPKPENGNNTNNRRSRCAKPRRDNQKWGYLASHDAMRGPHTIKLSIT